MLLGGSGLFARAIKSPNCRVNTMLNVIADYIKGRRHRLGQHVLFIGSSVKLPPQDIRLSTLLEQLATEQVGHSFQELAAERRGAAALEAFAQKVPDHAERCQLLREKLSAARPAEGHTQLSRLVKDGYFPTIFTMEPDDLLERALHTQHLEPDTGYHLLVAGVDEPETISLALEDSTRLVVVKCGGDLASKYLPLIPAEIEAGLQPLGKIITDAFSVVVIFTAYTDRDRPLLNYVPAEGGKIFWVNSLVPVSDKQKYTELKLESPSSVEYHSLQPEVVRLLQSRQSARHMLVREAGEFNEFSGKLVDWFTHRHTRRSRRRKELTVLRGGPYRFLDYFDVQDTDFFFGRDREIQEVLDLIRSHPLTVIFGRSGIGKTSLIKAGVMARLLGVVEDETPGADEVWLPVYAHCEDDPTASIRQATIEAIGQAGYELPEELAEVPLGELLAQTAEITGQDVVVFLDQFEEFFVKLGQKVRDNFISQIQDYLDMDKPDPHFVLVLREDFVGELYELRDRLPDIMQNVYRLPKLDHHQAHSAILKPAVNFGIQVERDLADQIVEDLSREGVEPAQLQIVCHRLYEALSPGSHTITQHTYQRLGKAEKILADYLDYVLSQLTLGERRLARAILKDMVASSELKAVRPRERIAQELGQSQETVERVLAKLVDYRLLRSVQRDKRRNYELVHEYVAEKVDDWMSEEEIKLKDVQDLLTRELNNFQKFSLLMGAEELRIIGEHRRELRISPEELDLIIRSAAAGRVDAEYWFSRATELADAHYSVLASLLTNSSQTVRETTYKHLSKHLHRELIPALVEGLNDEVPSVRRQARDYLETLQGELTRLLQTGPSDQQQVAAAGLGQIGSRHCERPLIEALTDQDEQLTETITDSLRQLGEEDSAQTLLKRLGAQPDQAWAVAYALGQLSVSDEALGRLTKAAQSDRATPSVMYALGLAQGLRREFDQAQANLQRALETTTSAIGRRYVQHAQQELVASQQQATTGTDCWLMFGGSPQHCAYLPQTLHPPLKQIWTTRTGGPIIASPVVADGLVYVGSRDNNFYALDSQRGTVRFTVTTDNHIEATAAVAEDFVVFGSTDGNLYALHAASGREGWRRQLAGPIRSAPNVADNRIFIGDEAGTLWAIDPTSGEVIWRVPTQDQILAAPAVAQGLVVIGSWDNSLYAYHIADGQLCWRIDTNGPVSSSPAISEGKVFCGSDDSMMYAIDLTGGQIVWQTPLGGRIRSSPAVSEDRVVTGCTDGFVYCLDKTTGEIVWKAETAEEVLASAVITGDIVYIGSKDGALYALDMETGESQWHYRTPYGIYSSPAVAEGTLFIGIAYYDVAAFSQA